MPTATPSKPINHEAKAKLEARIAAAQDEVENAHNQRERSRAQKKVDHFLDQWSKRYSK